MWAFSFLFALVIAVHTPDVTGLSLLPINICPIPRCAAPDPWNPRPTCTNQCEGDGDCGPNGKCCPMCGCSRCFGGLLPPPTNPPLDSCKTRKCPAGQECVEQQIFCFRAPCPRRTYCVPRKDNICPIPRCAAPDPWNPRPTCTNQCESDGECGPNGRCCPMCGCSRCFGGLLPPPTNPPLDSCKTRKCPAGQECVERQIFCFRAPCPRRTYCVPRKDKPGLCPLFKCPVPDSPTRCSRRQCRSDADCGGSRKCCTGCDGCRTCMDSSISVPSPVSCAAVSCVQGQVCVEEPTPHCEKPGQCPAPSGLAGICLFDPERNCLSDSQCYGALKCCSEGCGSVCKAPIS